MKIKKINLNILNQLDFNKFQLNGNAFIIIKKELF